MYYKVLKDNKVIDVLDHLTFVKYQEKHNIMVPCAQAEAQAIMSSDSRYAWHTRGLKQIPAEGYDVVDVQKIDEYEYKQLKMFGMKNIYELIDEYTLLLIEDGVI